LVAGSGLIVLLMWLGTLWLLGRGSRGAEIANVLALPMTVVGTLLTVLATLAALGLLVPQGQLRSQPQPAPQQADAEQPGQPASRWWPEAVRRIRRYVKSRAGVSLLLVLSLAATSPFWAAPLAARTRVLVAGCEHPTELRILTSEEQLEPARFLADRYRQSARRYGCERVHPYVFTLAPQQAKDTIATGWPDSQLRDTGPRPDVWLAEAVSEVAKLRNDPAGGAVAAEMITSDIAVASSPIVFGLPASAASERSDGLHGPPWSALFTLVGNGNWDVVRPDPSSSPTGELAIAMLYGSGTVGPETARLFEQRVGRSLDGGGYTLGGSLDVLCRYRQLNPPRTTVIVSEQALARFNNGDPLGGTCRAREGQRDNDRLLLANYPSDTRSLEYRLVNFGWSAPAQAAAAAGFGQWLVGEDGARALADVGLRRPSGLRTGGILTTRNGVRPDAIVNRDPVPAGMLEVATKVYRDAQRRDRVLFAVDTSGSMSAGSRYTVVTNGLINALKLLDERDEFGLSVFPAGPPGSPNASESAVIVPIGPRDGTSRHNATVAALSSIRPAGKTPVYRAITDGVVALESSDATKYSKALVVLTDGSDNASGLTDTQVVDAVSGKGVRVFIVAIGGASCATAVLRDVATVTGGQCVDADLPSFDAKLVDLFSAMRSED
jgi:Mg-chelatase subunit ChlD